jgi:hypothetical protein
MRAGVEASSSRKILRPQNVYTSRASYSQFVKVVADFSKRQVAKDERCIWITEKMMVGGGDVLWLTVDGWER